MLLKGGCTPVLNGLVAFNCSVLGYMFVYFARVGLGGGLFSIECCLILLLCG